jgi:hypothetical protein
VSRLDPVDRALRGQFDPGDGELPSKVHADTAGRVVQFETSGRVVNSNCLFP